eukprot:432544_1
MSRSNIQPTLNQIKSVRRAIRREYNTSKAKKQWHELYTTNHLSEAYGLDPNKSNSKIGKEAVTHILDSDGLRNQLALHTPSENPSIIPSCCSLNFFYTFDASQHPLHHELNLSQCFDNVDKMRNVFDDRLYNSKLVINIAGTDHEFWVKSIKQSGTAFVRAFGVQVSSYIMRYRPVIYVKLGPVIMALSGKNVGVGFCNLSTNKKGIKGHQMIHLEDETMDHVFVSFYTSNGITIGDISLELRSYQQKKGKLIPKGEPLVLFDGRITASYPPTHTYPTQSAEAMRGSYNVSPLPSVVSDPIMFPVTDTDMQSTYMDYRIPNPFMMDSSDSQSIIFDSTHSITPPLYSTGLSPMPLPPMMQPCGFPSQEIESNDYLPPEVSSE